jgi:hypothetical protein
MSEPVRPAGAVPLGNVDPCGSRQAGRRSGVTLTEAGPVVGLADGTVRAVDDAGTERWRIVGEGSAVTLEPFGGGILVGERSARGGVRLLADGTERWRHDAAEVIGAPTKDTRFFLPMVVDAAVAGETAFVAARRYERRDGGRRFESVVYALAPDGTVRWRYDADASPVSVAAHEGGVAVAYNRCPGAHDDGLVVLDGNGAVRWTWNPDGEGDRRVGDVATLDDGVVAAGHADYRGYRLDGGAVEWRVDLGRPVDRGADRVYTYPNHVHAGDSGVVFLTGNTFPEDGRKTAAHHPREQTALGFGPDGSRQWSADVGGFAHEVAADGDRLLVPVAQHFRDRDPSVHGWRLFDVADGCRESGNCGGVATAAALDGSRRVVVEEPVRYHDGETVHGRYALRRP